MSQLTRFPSLATATRGDMATLWKSANDRAAMGDSVHGLTFVEDFVALSDDQVTVTALNSATSEGFAKLAATNGVRSLVATTGADHRGAQVYIPGLGNWTPSSANTLIAQFDVNLQLASTFFIGLMEDGGTVFDASSALPTNKDYVGFYRINGGVVKFVTHLEGSPDVDDEASVLASDYYHVEATAQSEPTRLGFAIVKRNTVRIVVDDVAYKADMDSISSLALPDASMSVVLAGARGAAQDEADIRIDVDRIKLYQSA